MKKTLEKLDIDEKYTKSVKRPKKFTSVYDSVPHIAHYNYMADLLILPESSKGNRYLLVVVDLGNDVFDMEPMKNKDASTVLSSFKAMFKRKYIKQPEASIQTDGDGCFKSVFQKWLESEDIAHKTALPNRHSQMSNVESLNRQLGRLLNGYMNNKELKSKKQFLEWEEPLDIIRKELNEHRRLKEGDICNDQYPTIKAGQDAKFKKGDIVIRLLDAPMNVLGHQLNGKFREGDVRWNFKEPRKIVKVIPLGGNVPYRYLLEGIPNATFTDQQLMLADKEEEDSKYIVEKLTDSRTFNKVKQYLVKWKGYKDKTWESEKDLREDGIGDLIDAFTKKGK